jgi:hypothetical protein
MCRLWNAGLVRGMGGGKVTPVAFRKRRRGHMIILLKILI